MKGPMRKNGLAIAAAAAVLFATAPIAAGAAEQGAQTGRCMGANGCKGQSACKTAKNDCAGQNACKGQGYIDTTKEDCAKKGGKFEESKAEPMDQKSKPKS